jgi:hypothetical protein
MIAGVAQGGDRLATLTALRDRLAQDIDETHDPREVAALVLRLTDVLQQIDAMPTSQQMSAADEIAERRATRRRASSAHKARAKARQG